MGSLGEAASASELRLITASQYNPLSRQIHSLHWGIHANVCRGIVNGNPYLLVWLWTSSPRCSDPDWSHERTSGCCWRPRVHSGSRDRRASRHIVDNVNLL